MLGITTAPRMNQTPFKNQVGKKQDITKSQQSIADTKADTKPKKKMSKTTKGLMIAGGAALLLTGAYLLRGKFKPETIDSICNDLPNAVDVIL